MKSLSKPARNPGLRAGWAAAALLLGVGMVPVRGQLLTQTFTLAPGWNSVWLEVEPTNNAVGAVFDGVPLDSVWSFQARLSAVQFIENREEAVWNRSSWRVHVPTNRVESFQNNLFAIQANRPYLVRITHASPVVWSVTGVPRHRGREWVPDAYNLVGFPVDPGLPPSFASFFAAEPAHFDGATGRMRGALRLAPTGEWVPVEGHETMERGEAYWVYSEGPSAFTAPLDLGLEQGDTLNYGASLTELAVRLRNRGLGGRLVTVRDFEFPSRLSYYRFSPDDPEVWPALPGIHSLILGTGEGTDLRLAIRRREFEEPEHGSILEIADDEGTLHHVAVRARTPEPLAGLGSVTPEEEARRRAGLWVGTVTLKGVAEVNSGNLETNPVTREVTRTGVSTTPTPVRSGLDFRLILHVDTNGVARLLKDVVQLWREGSYTNDASGLRRMSEPGRFALLTDLRLVPAFRGTDLRDGVPVGRRVSTVGYDFDGGPENHLELAGSFAVGGAVTGTLPLASGSPTNPFRHRYHPDHDNLDATFRDFVPEAYAVAREIELTPLETDPEGTPGPEYGHDLLAGTYRERVTGLHKDDLHVSGVFRLRRVALTGVLNQ